MMLEMKEIISVMSGRGGEGRGVLGYLSDRKVPTPRQERSRCILTPEVKFILIPAAQSWP